VEVLNDDPHKHVEDEEADKEQEGDEVEEAPFVKILLGLKYITRSVADKH
jgi:hypothetical protein